MLIFTCLSKEKIALETDKHLKKVQLKTFDAMGPLPTLWGEVHDKQNIGGQGKLSGDTLTAMLDQPIRLLRASEQFSKFSNQIKYSQLCIIINLSKLHDQTEQ